MSCGHRLVQEMLDSIDEVWRSQDQKIEFLDFLRKCPPAGNFSGCPDRLPFPYSQPPNDTLPCRGTPLWRLTDISQI